MGVSRLTRGLMNLNKRLQQDDEEEEEAYIQMPKDSVLEQLDRDILKLKDEHNRINEQIAELESKAKSKLAEIKQLEEKRKWEEEKAKLESEFRDTFTNLLKLSWQTIPTFMNESFAHLRGIAAEYDRLRSEEHELVTQFNALKKSLAYNDTDIARIQNELYKTIGERIDIALELKRLLRFIDEQKASWTQEPDSVLRFLDVRREILQLKW
jgi:chromosome segregation ATPase